MHALEEGAAREILYSPDYFEMPKDSIARKLPEDSGFAGFRLQESTARDGKPQDWWQTHDWVAFLGASYRSEEHTSELQSLIRISYAVFCCKKKTTKTNT